MGSGTTVVAAKQNNRNGIGIDMEQEYCFLAMSRILKETK
jgi:DNA modification methylase